MADFPSTNVRINSQLSPFTDTQTFPLFDTAHGLGGLRTVGTTAEMNAIFDRRRTRGMMVYVSGVSAYYALIGTTANSGWTTEFQIGTGTNILPLNNTFTGLNTFTGGISASGGVTFAGDIGVNGGDIFTTSATASIFNTNATTLNIGGAATTTNLAAATTGLTLNMANGSVSSGTVNVNIATNTSGQTGYIFKAGGSSGLIFSDPTGITLGGTGQPGAIRIVSSTTEVSGAATFTGTISGTTASFTRLVTASQGISASSGIFGSLQSNSGATFSANVYVGATLSVNGNLIVNGTTTTINSTTISVDDKNIELGSVTSPNDTTADGGGISLKGTTDKTIVWSNTTSGSTLAAAWNFNQDINLTKSGNPGYYINGTVVIDGASLGPNIVNSNLTKVGTIATGVWQGTVIGGTYGGTGLSSYAKGDLLYAAASGSALSKLAVSSTQGQLIQADGSGGITWGDLLIADGSGNGVSTLSSGKYRIQDASTSVKGLSRYDSFNFSVVSGLVDIAAIDGGSYT